jgi:hypothetical protein
MSKNDNSNGESSYNRISILDRFAKGIINTIDPVYNNRSILSSKNDRFRSIMDRELELAKGVSHGSIVDFVASLDNVKPGIRSNENELKPDSSALFTKNINDIFGYFQDIYRNKFIEMADLKFIAKFIPSLGEAVRTTLDMVVSSDNIAETVNRIIDLPKDIEDDDRIAIMNEVERFEKEQRLLKKLRNVVYKKALVTGKFYIYTISYKDLFTAYAKKLDDQDKKGANNKALKSGKSMKSITREQTMDIDNVDTTKPGSDIAMSVVTEGVKNLLASSPLISGDGTQKMTNNDVAKTVNMLNDMLPNIKCDKEDIYYEALEGAMSIFNHDLFDKFDSSSSRTSKSSSSENTNVDINTKTTDGVKDIKDVNSKHEKFDIPGTYIKYVDSKNIIPITIFDKKIGYYLIHATPRKGRTPVTGADGIMSIGNTVFSTVNVAERKKEEAISNIVDTITEGIIRNFSDKFVTNNSEYKKLIADCIIANGIVDTDYNVQFIPAENIIEFKVNENDNGDGESILSESLFPAKLLLSLLVCRMLNYVNKTGNKTIAHIHKGPIDNFTFNQVNRVIRDMQDSDITFNDLLSPNIVFNKFNRDGKISMPTSKGGTHLVDFEIQEGQTIEMNPEYETKLEGMAVMGTGVPSIIMDYNGNAELAKQYVSANIKFAGRVATHQSDFEEPTTDLYIKNIEDSNLTDEQKEICRTGLKFRLPRPKVLVNGNNNEFVRTTIETAEMIADMFVSKDAQGKDADIRRELIARVVKSNSPYFDWEAVDKMFKEIRVDMSKPKSQDKDNNDNSIM